MGAIWNSTLFPGRAPEENVCFTLFIGGALNKKLMRETKDNFIKKAVKEFSEIMNIKEEPVFTDSRFWEKAIPQYNLDYSEHAVSFEIFEKKNPGFFLGGNYRRGIALGDCLHSAEIISKEVKNYFNREKPLINFV